MPSLDAPVPTDGLWGAVPGVLDLTFSHPILADPTYDPTNWFVRFAGRQRPVVSAAAVAGIVRVVTAIPIVQAGPDIVTYTPPPFEILSDTARQIPAAAFTDFPIHA